ncbi:hypothetical protein V1506DRAFT_571191 [Lipomyces tetrasporus]
MTYSAEAPLQGAHIIPFSASSHQELRKVLSIFAGESVETQLTDFVLVSNVERRFYRLRKLYPDKRLTEALARHNDGEVLLFGWKSHWVPRPSSLFCNVHLAIGYLLRDSNAFPMISAILRDEEEFNSGNTGGEYWLVTGASYLERRLRGLAASDYSDTAGSDEEERLVMDEVTTAG